MIDFIYNTIIFSGWVFRSNDASTTDTAGIEMPIGSFRSRCETFSTTVELRLLELIKTRGGLDK